MSPVFPQVLYIPQYRIEKDALFQKLPAVGEAEGIPIV
jgi:hypothetical protein